MASKRRYDDGRPRPWQVTWSEYQGTKANRKFFSESFRTEAQADAFRRQKEDQIALGSMLVNPTGGKETLGTWAERWFADYQRTVKPSTARKSRGLLDATILPAFAHKPVRSIRAAHVGAWLLDIEVKRNLKPATVKHHYLVLSNVLRFAAQNGAIAANPAQGVRLPSNRTRGTLPREPRFLTPIQVSDLAENLGHPYDLLVQFAALKRPSFSAAPMRVAALG